MKWLVNGREVELEGASSSEVVVQRLSDRLVVRTAAGARTALVVRHAGKVSVSYLGRTFEIEKPRTVKSGGAASDGLFVAPMPGQIIDVLVKVGASVSKGEKLLVLEAMKTQQPVIAPFDGVVEAIFVEKGAQVQDAEKLIKIVPNSNAATRDH